MDTNKFIDATDIPFDSGLKESKICFNDLPYDVKMRITKRNKIKYIKLPKIPVDYTRTIENYHSREEHDVKKKNNNLDIPSFENNKVNDDGFPINSLLRITKGPNKGMILLPKGMKREFHPNILPDVEDLLSLPEKIQQKYKEILDSNLKKFRNVY